MFPLEDLGDVPPEDRLAVEKGLETPGQARAHALPQPIPGLNSPVPTIPHFGGSPVPTAPTRQPPAANRAEFQRYTNGLRRDMGRPATADPKLSDIMDEMYRPNAKVGSGSTADAVRAEKATGQPTGGRWHSQKA